MNGLADVDVFKISIQVCVWLGFRPPACYGFPRVKVILLGQGKNSLKNNAISLQLLLVNLLTEFKYTEPMNSSFSANTKNNGQSSFTRLRQRHNFHHFSVI